MRGPLRLAQNRGGAPSPSFASLTRPLPVQRGEVTKAIPFSRRVSRPSYANQQEVRSNEANAERAVTGFADQATKELLRSSLPANKRKRNAEKRVSYPPRLVLLSPPPLAGEGKGGGASALKAQRARLSAFHHGACCSERTPQLSSRYALPGTRSGARPRWFERPCALQHVIRKTGKFMRHQRALPAPSCPSPAGFPADRSSCRPGVIPRSRPGAGCKSARGHSLHFRDASRKRPLMSEIR